MDWYLKHKRFTVLDGMRGFAALAVMMFHFSEYTGFKLFSFGSLAVDFFFCLSGFVIAHAYQVQLKTNLSITSFALKRVVRLYPMFFIGLLLGIVALWLKINVGKSDFTFYEWGMASILNAFYVPYFHQNYVMIGSLKVGQGIFPVNGPAWSLFLNYL